MRQIVAAALPLGKGVLVDPFAGSGSTLAAAEAMKLRSIGIEMNETYFAMARRAIPKLAAYRNGNPVNEPVTAKTRPRRRLRRKAASSGVVDRLSDCSRRKS
jgi:tRNA G10  N-methylase Trm11